MPRKPLIAIVSAALLAVPSLAVAGGPPVNPGHSAEGTRAPSGDRPGRPARSERACRHQGEGIRTALPGGEQEARRRSAGNAVQPVRHRHGKAGDRRDQQPRAGMREAQQEARRGPEGHAVQQVRRGRGEAPRRVRLRRAPERRYTRSVAGRWGRPGAAVRGHLPVRQGRRSRRRQRSSGRCAAGLRGARGPEASIPATPLRTELAPHGGAEGAPVNPPAGVPGPRMARVFPRPATPSSPRRRAPRPPIR